MKLDDCGFLECLEWFEEEEKFIQEYSTDLNLGEIPFYMKQSCIFDLGARWDTLSQELKTKYKKEYEEFLEWKKEHPGKEKFIRTIQKEEEIRGT